MRNVLPGHTMRTLIAGSLLLAAGFPAGASAQTDECDCSCEAFGELKQLMEDMRNQAQSGQNAIDPMQMQALAACTGECAMAWGQCESDRSTADRDRQAARSARSRADEPAADSEPEAYALGEPREDLERFYGVYGSDDQPGRDFFVTKAKRQPGAEREIPSGYLMVGAMWGDVAPWYMKSVGELRFEQQWVNPGGTQLVVEFETDADGNAKAMYFRSGIFSDRGRLRRTGELPEGW